MPYAYQAPPKYSGILIHGSCVIAFTMRGFQAGGRIQQISMFMLPCSKLKGRGILPLNQCVSRVVLADIL